VIANVGGNYEGINVPRGTNYTKLVNNKIKNPLF